MKQCTVTEMFSIKSLNFRGSKTYFPPQKAHSSFHNLMNPLNIKQMMLFWSSLLRDYVNDELLSKCRTPFRIK